MRYWLILFMFFCNTAFGATQLKKVVAPSGGDYTSLEACMNANEQNLVTADKYFDVEISGTWSSADTTSVTVHNYTTDETRYINIYTTGDARHDGTAYKSGAYKLNVSASQRSIFIFQVMYLTLDGLVITGTNSGAIYRVLESDGTSVNHYNNITNCILYHQATNSSQYNALLYFWAGAGGTQNGFCSNNIIFAGTTTHAGNDVNGIQDDSTAQKYYNNTVYGMEANGIRTNSNNTLLKNNISYNNIGADFNGGVSTSSTNNLSQDATAPAYNTYYQNKTLTFVNTTAGSENFHLASTDTDAIDKGADLSGTFTTDIDGTTRTGTWDIGADEYVSETPSGPTDDGFRYLNDSVWNDAVFL